MKKIERTIEEEKSSKVLRRNLNNNKCIINQLEREDDRMTNNRNGIIEITENYYEYLYSSKTRIPPNITRRRIPNVGSEEIKEIQTDEIRKAVEGLKYNRAPSDDGVIPT